ncbi:MAG: hypothetical protein HY221_01065 [Candidatus Sungbacteria bacterium]|uniref:DUF3307 domain-containing protein n=1 Tax=Candidatus Sungiibacteriota bacterium TaxID=2750080 RepID=A0A932VPI6_9BACT|nr:hypothetical protein [Candidatus Sungbacteria bacterium]
MTLTTHSIIAVAVTKPIAATNPLLIFVVAIASHYLADALPHWDYTVRTTSYTDNEGKEHWNALRAQNFRARVRSDIGNFAMDGFLGAAITLALVHPVSGGQWLWATASLIGGALPDFLQGLYLSGLTILKPAQRFHDALHTKIKLGHYPLIGIPFQLAILLIAAWTLI